MRSILRAQKNVVEQNSTKGVPAPSARPTAVLRSPRARIAPAALTVCYAKWAHYLFILFIITLLVIKNNFIAKYS
jgi:hypothetical protein